MAPRPCDHCGYPIQDGVQFCPACGAWRDFASQAGLVSQQPSQPAYQQPHQMDGAGPNYAPAYVPPPPASCPRCGSPVGRYVFCSHCGLRLPQADPGYAPQYNPYYQQRKKGMSTGAVVGILVLVLALVISAALVVASLENAITAADDRSGTFVWSYQGKTYSLKVDVPGEDYSKYKSDRVQRYATTYTQMVSLAHTYVTTSDPTVIKVANDLNDKSSGMSDVDRASMALAFVQYIEYTDDSDSAGKAEYFRYPVETLYDQTGDCEDTAFLLAALLEVMGFDAVVLFFEGHAAVGVDVDEPYFTGRYTYQGVDYYYCETTTTGWRIGEIPQNNLGQAYVSQVS